MNIKHKSFLIDQDLYSPEGRWATTNAKHGAPPPSQRFALSKDPDSHIFAANTYCGFTICENYFHSTALAELSTGGVQVVSLDFSPSAAPVVAVTLATGPVLLIDALQRRRGSVTWFNQGKQLYSKDLPVLTRWANSEEFVVLFKDNTLWVLQKHLVEDAVLIGKYRDRLKEQEN